MREPASGGGARAGAAAAALCAAALCAAPAQPARAEPPDFPEFLGTVPNWPFRAAMRANGCREIRNFYDSYAVERPPFLADWPRAVACEAVDGGRNGTGRYKLLVDTGRTGRFSSCPSEIDLGTAKPGGLALDTRRYDARAARKRFSGWEDSEAILAALEPGARVRVLSVECRGGGSAEFLCLDGAWLRRDPRFAPVAAWPPRHADPPAPRGFPEDGRSIRGAHPAEGLWGHGFLNRSFPETLGTAPLRVLEGMRANGCRPLRGFYSGARKGLPYTWLDDPSGRRLGFAFLCEVVDGRNAADGYMVVVEAREGTAFHGCPRKALYNPRHEIPREGISFSFRKYGEPSLLLHMSGDHHKRYSCRRGAWVVSGYQDPHPEWRRD